MEFSEMGAANYAKLINPGKDSISQRSAYRNYGEARVKRWLQNGMLKPVRSGAHITSKIIYSRAELMAADKAEKIDRYINK